MRKVSIGFVKQASSFAFLTFATRSIDLRVHNSMRVAVSPPRGGRIILLPEAPHLPVPLYDEEEEYLLIPQEDFDQLETAQRWAEEIVSKWAEKREQIVKELLEMASSLDGLQYKCNISSLASSSVGVASGAAVIGGMILMPPVAIGGLVAGTVAATWNLGTGIYKLKQMKTKAHQAKTLLENDKDLLHSVLAAINALEMALETAMAHKDSVKDLPEGTTAGEGVANAVGMIGLAPNIISIGARIAIRETVTVSSNVLKGVVHAAAGIGIALDLLTIILNAKDLAAGSRCELAVKLRQVAEDIEMERMKLQREFINHVSLAN